MFGTNARDNILFAVTSYAHICSLFIKHLSLKIGFSRTFFSCSAKISFFHAKFHALLSVSLQCVLPSAPLCAAKSLRRTGFFAFYMVLLFCFLQGFVFLFVLRFCFLQGFAQKEPSKGFLSNTQL